VQQLENQLEASSRAQFESADMCKHLAVQIEQLRDIIRGEQNEVNTNLEVSCSSTTSPIITTPIITSSTCFDHHNKILQCTYVALTKTHELLSLETPPKSDVIDSLRAYVESTAITSGVDIPMIEALYSSICSRITSLQQLKNCAILCILKFNDQMTSISTRICQKVHFAHSRLNALCTHTAVLLHRIPPTHHQASFIPHYHHRHHHSVGMTTAHRTDDGEEEEEKQNRNIITPPQSTKQTDAKRQRHVHLAAAPIEQNIYSELEVVKMKSKLKTRKLRHQDHELRELQIRNAQISESKHNLEKQIQAVFSTRQLLNINHPNSNPSHSDSSILDATGICLRQLHNLLDALPSCSTQQPFQFIVDARTILDRIEEYIATRTAEKQFRPPLKNVSSSRGLMTDRATTTNQSLAIQTTTAASATPAQLPDAAACSISVDSITPELNQSMVLRHMTCINDTRRRRCASMTSSGDHDIITTHGFTTGSCNAFPFVAPPVSALSVADRRWCPSSSTTTASSLCLRTPPTRSTHVPRSLA
jgi:hypothetical protein